MSQYQTLLAEFNIQYVSRDFVVFETEYGRKTVHAKRLKCDSFEVDFLILEAFVNGNSYETPQGLLNATQITEGQLNTDNLRQLRMESLVDADWIWIANRNIMLKLRCLRDSITGAYFYQPALRMYAPDTFLGHSAYIAPMPDDRIIFANLKKGYGACANLEKTKIGGEIIDYDFVKVFRITQ